MLGDKQSVDADDLDNLKYTEQVRPRHHASIVGTTL